MLARVEALLRRVAKKGRASVVRFEFSDVEADFERGQVRRSGKPVTMAAKELQLLRYLIDRRGTVVTREDLLQHVWEYQWRPCCRLYGLKQIVSPLYTF